MITALTRLPLARLTRAPRAWIATLGWLAVGVVDVVTVRARGDTTPATHVMRGSFCSFILPLAVYVVVGTVLGRGGVRESVRGLVALGADRTRAVGAAILVAIASASVVGAVLGLVLAAIGHGHADPPLVADLFASTWIGALGGAAYGAFFAAGASLGKGWMRGVFLALDWVFGTGGGFGAIFTPRGHVRSLVGAGLVFGLSPRTSSVLLFFLVALWGAFGITLARRRGR